MIGLATLQYDPEGALLLNELPSGTNFGQITRRVSRRATLDGGAAFEDRGSYVADREIRVELRPDPTLGDTLGRLVETYRWLLISTPDGVFLVAPNRAELHSDRFRLTFLVSEKRSA
jgi:hypothetical protein